MDFFGMEALHNEVVPEAVPEANDTNRILWRHVHTVSWQSAAKY